MTPPLDSEQNARYNARLANDPVPDPAPDPAAVWATAAPRHHSPAPDPTPPYERDTPWRWGWSWLIGFHYGPIPVGLLIALPLLIALRSH